MRFADIPGLSEIKKSLIKSVQEEKVAHAQIFTGNEGGGNLAMARAFVNYLYCENKSQTDSCGECPSCQKNLKLIHPDVHYVYPVLNSKDGKKVEAISKSFLEEWRNFLPSNPFPVLEDWATYFGAENKQAIIYREESREIIRDLSLMSFEGNFKTMIIWLPELMHLTAANGILKILEEPPSKTLFVLVSNNPGQIITTILSRCISISIRPFFDKEIEEYLIENGTPKEKAGQISHLAEGSLNAANSLTENLEDDNQSLFTNWMRGCFEFNINELITASDEFGRSPKVSQRSLLEYGLNILRESLVANLDNTIQLAVESEKPFIKNFSKVLNPDLIETMSSEIEATLIHLGRNANARIVFLDLSLRLAITFRQRKTANSE